ncbi:centrosomal protein 20 [Nilaparvata lugens]|uniref:centrosomal protein 20 n=1 Tax=Nilaparvata lugens TaxID=108931 RepID=UPI00193D50B4|nr:centrosomal protein 20 [Nilaparvata lugens]
MALKEDLIEALTESLRETENFGKLKAALKVELLNILSKSEQPAKRPDYPREIHFLNKLVTEYLLWVGYKSTASILKTESGTDDHPVRRSDLLKELNLKDDGQSDAMPILLNLVSTFQKISESSL